ncbi:efflux RND transporter periplasmic adaptor subunit [Thiohalocapsa sp.]|uniref:efflux RND transporter periplasmic adaptor subunit n=1 Tax=Thiohalocapsa sp. TaxID=2497641 RepID=UPI0025E98CA2|nr:efflux RND transporter periplasmic adaptor subunit [Thiohalocapsa sp.]
MSRPNVALLDQLAIVVPVVALTLSLLPGCSGDDGPPAEPPVRPVKTVLVATPEAGGERKFAGRVDAEKKAELAFRVPGTVQEILVKEGDAVTAGQELIRVDPTDYEIAVRDAQATFDRTESDFKRAQELVEDGFISGSEFDTKEAEFKNAEAALARAKQDLAYTTLQASFDGIISKRYVEPFEEVEAKQAVLAMQDNDTLQVKVDVPESVLLAIRPSDAGRPEPGRVPTWVSFDGRAGKRFQLTLREVSTRADPDTQTFEVTYTMPAPEDFLVFPGMTATVTADLSQLGDAENRVLLPASAVTAGASLEPFVWVVDEPEMTARKVPVEVGQLAGGAIEVTEGLSAGERVVVAGVGYLAEGMEVRLLPQREEAEPRAGERPTLAEPVPAPADAGGDAQ